MSTRIVLQEGLTKHRSRPLAETTSEACDDKITSFLLTTINGGYQMNKPILLVAMLAMVLLAAAPALTQSAPTDIEASPALTTDAVQTAGEAAVDPAAAPATPAAEPSAAPADVTVGCELLYSPPGDQCTVDANGEITLPDGTTAPVLVTPDGNVFIQDINGALTLVGTGASFITPEDPAASEVPATTEPVA
jgi:hypothetical protein